MTDREALLAAIREDPEEDTPRLAFADLLDERGDSFFSDWAAIIRSQIESARLERYSPRWMELAREQGTLFQKRRAEVTPHWNSRLGQAAYRRGFQEAHQFYPAETFLKSADVLFGRNPIRAVRLLGLRQSGKETALAILRHPAMARVETLDVTDNSSALGTKMVRLLAPRMPRLRALGLGGLGLTAASAADLLGGLLIPNLEALDLSDNQLFRPEGYAQRRPESLFHSPALANLRWLDLARTNPTPEALRVLAFSPVLRKLRYLNLGWPSGPDASDFGAEGAQMLAGGLLREVEFLYLSGQQIGTQGLNALLRSPFLDSVRELDLSGNQLDDDAAIALAASPRVANLRKLDLSGNRINQPGFEALIASPHLAGLRILKLIIPEVPVLADIRNRLRERFPETEPTIPGLLLSDFFGPIP